MSFATQHDEHCVVRRGRVPGRIAEIDRDRFGEPVAWIAHLGRSQFLFWVYVADLGLTLEQAGERQRERFRAALRRKRERGHAVHGL